MGEQADYVLEGFLCQVCGDVVDFEEPGFPRTCESCIELETEAFYNE